MNPWSERIEIGAEPRVDLATAAQPVRNPDHGLNQTLSHCALSQLPFQTILHPCSGSQQPSRRQGLCSPTPTTERSWSTHLVDNVDQDTLSED
jgi:hypothetical protein